MNHNDFGMGLQGNHNGFTPVNTTPQLNPPLSTAPPISFERGGHAGAAGLVNAPPPAVNTGPAAGMMNDNRGQQSSMSKYDWESNDAYYQRTGIGGLGINQKPAANPNGYAQSQNNQQWSGGGYQPTWQEMAGHLDAWGKGGLGWADPRHQELLAKFGGDEAALNKWINRYSYNPGSFAGWAEANPGNAAGGSMGDYKLASDFKNKTGMFGTPPPVPGAGAPGGGL